MSKAVRQHFSDNANRNFRYLCSFPSGNFNVPAYIPEEVVNAVPDLSEYETGIRVTDEKVADPEIVRSPLP